MTLVIDTSVIVKWFVREAGHEEALSLLESTDPLCCPDFALVEAANVLWRKVRGGEVSGDQAQESILQLPRFFDEVVPAAELLDDGFGLARLLSHSVYDCMFLACALRQKGDTLVSDDMAFLKKSAEHGFADAIRPLSGESVGIDLDLLRASVQSLTERHAFFQDVLDSVKAAAVGETGTISGLLSFSVSKLKPAFDSPAHVNVKRELLSLELPVVQAVMAVCWYGRRYGSQGLERDLRHARDVVRDVEADAAYIISNLQHFEAGIARIENDRLNQHSESVDD